MPKKKYIPKDNSPYIKDICDRVYHNGLCQIEGRDCPLDRICNQRGEIGVTSLSQVNTFIRLLKKFATFEKDVEIEIAHNEYTYNSLMYGGDSPEAMKAGKQLHELLKESMGRGKGKKNVKTN